MQSSAHACTLAFMVESISKNGCNWMIDLAELERTSSISASRKW